MLISGFLFSRLLLGACSEMVRECLATQLAEDVCLVLPNVSIWEVKVGTILKEIENPLLELLFGGCSEYVGTISQKQSVPVYLPVGLLQ